MIATFENIATVQRYCASYGIELEATCIEKMLRHLELVVETNKHFNLTRIVDEHDALIRHLVDSMLFLPSIAVEPTDSATRFVDIGTGAGFPGIPLALATNMRGLLIDSVGKKAVAVEGFLAELGLTERVASQRIRVEELARIEAQEFDIVTARAVADLGVLVEYASPLLKQGGRLVVSKGQIAKDEIVRGVRTGKLTGMEQVSRETYELPEAAGHREIITYVRKGKCSVKLPRQTGAAKHKPLCM